MRIRSIKPEVHLDEELWDLEQTTQLPIFRAFTGLWGAADRDGLFEWRPRKLKTAILPYWEGDFSRVLDALSTRGFIVRYESQGRSFGLVRTFHKHQVVNNREVKSVLPPPPENIQTNNTLTRARRVDDACTTPLVPALVEYGREYGTGTGTGTVSAQARPGSVEPRASFNSKDLEQLFSELRSAVPGGGRFKAQRSDYDRSQKSVEWAHEQDAADPASAARASIAKFLTHATGREAAGWPFWAWANDPGRWFAYVPMSSGNLGQRRATGGMGPVITEAEVAEAQAQPLPAWRTRQPEDA